MPLDDTAAAIAAAFDELSSNESDSQSDVVDQEASTEQESGTTDAPPKQEQQPAKTEAEPGSEEQVPLTGNIPVSRHKAILEKARREAEERVARVAWAERLQVDSPETLQERIAAIQLAEQDPEEFLRRYEAILESDPRFSRLVQSRRQPAPPPQPEKRVEDDPMPLPDVDLEDGRRLYSDNQQMRLLDWQARQIEKRLTDRYAPIEQEFRGQREWNAALERQFSVLEDARANWDAFRENEAEIKQAMMADRRRTLESAYRAVVIPKLKAEKARMEAEIRKSLLAELNSKPSANTEAPSRAGDAPPKSYAGMATSDIVAEAYRELQESGG